MSRDIWGFITMGFGIVGMYYLGYWIGYSEAKKHNKKDKKD